MAKTEGLSKKEGIVLLALQKVFSACACCRHEIGCAAAVRAIPEAPLALNAISFPRARLCRGSGLGLGYFIHL